MKQKDKNICFIAEEGGISARPLYRAKNPALGLRQHGWETRVCPVLYEQEDHTFNGWTPGETGPAKTPKIIVAHTFMTPKKGDDGEEYLAWESQQAIIETARVHGQKFLFDLDDDIWNIPADNPDSSRPRQIMGNYNAWIRDVNSSDGLIVSTPSIKKSALEAGEFKVPIHVVRNSIDLLRYNRNHKVHTPLRVGWIGDLVYRSKDFETIIPLLYKVLEGLRGEVEFWHIGAHFEIGFPSIRDDLKKFPVDIVERPWMPAEEFQQAVEQIDICLIPAREIKFNNGRSNATALACIAGGIPFIASATAEYRHFYGAISNLLTGEWEHELKRLIHDEEYREEMVQSEFNVISNFDTPKKRAEEYIRIFEELCQS